ncbi:unnamed protein product [Owenia fusiformis]|uniref:Uncharacterized protein n=1 Tax=Owenia fusiformis TaxID=6347 RepID=A0A8S4QAR8_OWEFU|nr:unnamed protein product [Owenia fusiformis]
MALMLTGTSLTFPELYRLSVFANAGYEKCKLKLSDLEIKEHKDEILSEVMRLCHKLERYPVLQVRDLLPNGSYFNDTSKIIHPDEGDLLLIFRHISLKNVNISDVKGKNRVKLTICDENLKEQLNDIKLSFGLYFGLYKEVVDFENNLQSDITSYIQQAIRICLCQLEGIHYLGASELGPTSSEWECLRKLRLLNQEGSASLYGSIIRYGIPGELRESCRNGTYNPHLPPNTIALDKRMHGPCVRIRIGGGKHTTDIDLGFCIELEHHQTEHSTHIALPYFQAEWVRSVYNSKHKLDEDHNKLLMLLKLLILECHLVHESSTFSSHALKILVLRHQARCTSERSLGSCLCDVAHHVFELYEMNEEYGHLLIYDSRKKLRDVDFPCVDVQPTKLRNYWIMPVVLYITIRALRSGCCTGEEALHVDRWLIISELWNNKELGGYVQLNAGDKVVCKLPIQRIDELLTRFYIRK